PRPAAMLQAIALSKNFGGLRAVDGVSFNLPPGCLAGLIGPNGAGKTTLFNLLAGSLKPSGGQLLFHGRPIAGLPPHAIFAAGTARTFQIPRPSAAITVLENMMVAPRRQAGERFGRTWLSPAAIAGEERGLRDKALGLLAFLGLEGLAGAPARVLSGGQRKLLELGRVLMADPKLILLDEPGAGVNPALLAVILDKTAPLKRPGIGLLR